MNISRFVSLGAAVVICALQWVPFFSTALITQSVQAAGVPVAGNASDASMPVVVITARRKS